MNTIPFKKFSFIVYPLPLLIFLTGWFLATRQDIISQPRMSMAVTIDLIVLIPLSWLLVTSYTKVPKITIFPVTVLSILGASLILPEEHHQTLDLFTLYFLPLLELGFVGFIIYKALKMLRRINKQAKSNADIYGLIKTTCSGMTSNKRISAILSAEIAMLYFTFGAWRSRPAQKNEFSGYRENGIISIIAGVLLILIAETLWVHRYLLTVNGILAWGVFVLSIYSGMQLFAHLKAVRTRHHVLHDDHLILRYGLFADVVIDYHQINEIVFTANSPEEGSAKKLALLGDLEPHNVLIQLKAPVVIHKIYGLKTKATTLCFHCDEKERFRLEVEERLDRMLNE